MLNIPDDRSFYFWNFLRCDSIQEWSGVSTIQKDTRRHIRNGIDGSRIGWHIVSHIAPDKKVYVKRKEIVMDDTAKEKKIIWIVWSLITAIVYIVSYLLQSEEILIKGNLAIGLLALLFPCSNLFVAIFCDTNKEEDMAIGILMLILAFISCCLSAFVVIADYVG